MENIKLDADQLWGFAFTYIKTVVDTLREPFLILDENLKVLSANKIFYLFFQVNKEETEGKLVYELGNNQWNIPKLRILLEDILPKNTHFEDFKVEHDFPVIGHKIMILNARRIYTSPETDSGKPIMLLAMEDVTKQVRLEEQLRDYARKLSVEVAKKTVELENRIKELEEANKTLMRRELRMMELEKEIESMKKLIKMSHGQSGAGKTGNDH